MALSSRLMQVIPSSLAYQPPLLIKKFFIFVIHLLAVAKSWKLAGSIILANNCNSCLSTRTFFGLVLYFGSPSF